MATRHAILVSVIGIVVAFSAAAAHASVWTAYPQPDSTQYGFQQALDLAQPGDAVELMPGRYDQFGLHEFTGGLRTWAILGFVHTANLTIRSATSELAVIGPADLTDQVGGNLTTGIGIDAGSTGLVIESVSIENMTWGISGLESLVVAGCEFGQSTSAGASIVVSGSNSLDLRSSTFLFGSELHLQTDSPGAVVRIDECTFRGGSISSATSSAATSLNISRTSFDPGGLLLAGPILVTASDCTFGPVTANLILLQGASFSADDCTFDVGVASVAQVSGLGSFRADHCHFESSGTNEMFLISNSALEITNSNILHGTNNYVFAYVPKSLGVPLKLTNNYWSENTEAEIRHWMHDADAFGDSSLVRVDILPLRDQEVLPTKQTTAGSLKSLFRPRN